MFTPRFIAYNSLTCYANATIITALHRMPMDARQLLKNRAMGMSTWGDNILRAPLPLQSLTLIAISEQKYGKQ